MISPATNENFKLAFIQSITSLCYENLKDIISENKDLVKTEKNPQGSFPMHIIHLLFHESRFIGNVLTKK